MRLDSTLKRNQLPKHFLNFLGFVETFKVKFSSVTFTLILSGSRLFTFLFR
jgi:hypothetical protein